MRAYVDERVEVLIARREAGEVVLAVGRAAELRRLDARFGGISVSGPGEVLVVTERRMLWVGGNPRLVTSLPFALVRSFTEVNQAHRYALILDHGEVERLQWVPAYHLLWWSWGNAEAVRHPTRTILAFSRRDTKAAVAIRAQLAGNMVHADEPVSLPADGRARDRGKMVLQS